MKKTAFLHPMRKYESIFGWFYLVMHMFLISVGISFLYYGVLLPNGIELTDAQLNALYYGVGFVLILLIMFRFLKASFHDLCSNKLNSFSGITTGYVINYVLGIVVNLVVMLFLSDNMTNPNNAAVTDQIKINQNVMTAVSVLLAPIVEEVLFRGVAFGTIRKKNRLLAYIVSVFLFAVYHLLGYIIADFSFENLLYLIQYLPAGIALAYCYERSRNIWGPIFLHMLINFIAVTVTVAL